MSMQPWRLDRRDQDDDEIHHGKNVKRIRELLGWKQEALAETLGHGWSQKKVSLLESKPRIRDIYLSQIAKTLGIPEELLRTGSKNKLRTLLQKVEEARPPISEQQVILATVQSLLTLCERLNDTTAVMRNNIHLLSLSPAGTVSPDGEGNRQTDSMPM